MKKNRRRWLRNVMATVLLLSVASVCAAATYYVHPISGDDTHSGTSREFPLQTLARASSLRLLPGDRVLLAGGQTFNGQLSYERLAGSAINRIAVSSYQDTDAPGDARAIIDAKGCAAGVLLKNCAYFEIGNLIITANAGGMKPGPATNVNMRCGVLITATQPEEFSGFTLTNITIKNVFFEEPGLVRTPEEVRSANGTQRYGWGIRFMVDAPAGRMNDIKITDCQIENVSHTGLKFTGPGNGLQNLEVRRVQITQSGGPGVQMSGVRNGHFSHLDVNRSGSTNDTRNWGRGSGLWTWGSSDVIIEKSRFQNANGPGDSAGVHIDFNCRNVIVQYNLSANNAGGFCEILGNNYNCAYRYNVSINDGHRIKGRDGAFQEGKIFWLSGYTGDHSEHKGPFNTYFYNNTIFVGEEIVAKLSVTPTARGVLIANNIFHIVGRSEPVRGDQNKADHGQGDPLKNVVFKNNLYLRPDNWPAGFAIQDESPRVGDARFAAPGGLELRDYAPKNSALVRNQGISIPKLPGDAAGLASGLEVEFDILGNQIQGLPDLGAIEINGRDTSELGSK